MPLDDPDLDALIKALIGFGRHLLLNILYLISNGMFMKIYNSKFKVLY